MPESESQKYKPKFIRSGTLLKKGGSLQVTVPNKYAKQYNLKPKDEVMLFEYGKALLLIPVPKEELAKLALKGYLPPTS